MSDVDMYSNVKIQLSSAFFLSKLKTFSDPI
jgi:hypothetical protein